MPPKKVKRGGPRENAGRKVDSTGEYSKARTPEERRRADRENKAKSRGQEKIPEARIIGETSSAVQKGPGRPPSNLEKRPLKGVARQEYKLENQRENRKTQKIRSIRQAAVANRKDRRGGDLEELLGGDLQDQAVDVNLNEAVEDENSTSAGSFVEKARATSRASYFDKLREAKILMSKLTVLEKVDISAKILVSHDLNEEKLTLRISPKDVKTHLALGLSKLSKYHLRERAQQILDIIESHADGEAMLVKLLQEEVYSSQLAASLLTAAGLHVDDAFLTRKQRGEKAAREEAMRLIKTKSGPNRDIGVKTAIAVATKCAFTLEKHGDEVIFAECVGSSVKFARRVLQALAQGQTESLFKRSKRRDSLVASDWPGVLRTFLDRPLYSRPVPGNDTVSTYYGHRVPKILLLMTRKQVLTEFKDFYKECPFSVRTLLKEIPANYVTMSERDFGRNACVLHTNFRHILRHLLKQGLLPDSLSSCRFIASQSLCSSSDSFNPLEPLTWDEKCVAGECETCPGFSITCPPDKENLVISLAQWENKFCELKQKKIHSLFSRNIKMGEVVFKFNIEIKKMTEHVYRAARIWESFKV